MLQYKWVERLKKEKNGAMFMYSKFLMREVVLLLTLTELYGI